MRAWFFYLADHFLLTDYRCLVRISLPQLFEEFIELTLFLPWGQQCWGSGKEFCLLSYIFVTKIAFKPPLMLLRGMSKMFSPVLLLG